jgi:hypothetical protein
MDNKKRKQRTPLSLEDKINIIKKKETGINISDEALALEYNVDRSTISGIIRKKEDLLKTYSNAKTSELKRTRIQPSRFPVLEDALYKWFQGLRSQNIPVSQELLKKKVMYFYNEAKNKGVQFPQFEASSGWLENFQNRYGISSKNITGESQSANLQNVEEGRARCHVLLAEYELDDIYNADETGLFFRLAPDQTLATKSDQAKGYKKDKERITILFCCNASGKNKIKPLVIGKSQKPRCFNHINIKTLPVRYSNNKSAWMTMQLWNNWLKWFDSTLKKKSILLIDNCPAHTDGSHLGLKNLQVIYLPPNTTSHIQPCDAGIIHNFKVNYQNTLVSKWIKDLDEGNDVKKINIKQAIDIVGEAWDNVKEETIKNCWKKTEILPPSRTIEIADEPTSNDILEELVDGLRKVNINHTNNLIMSAEDFVNIDSGVITTELPTDEDIVEDILVSEGVHVEEEDVSEESEEEPVISIEEGRKVLENAKKFLEQQEFATEKDIKYVKELIKRLNSFENKAKRQSLLTEFY